MNIKKRSEKFFHSREGGIALVITLILLSIITFMTVTFMVISQHAKNQVSTTTQQLIAQQAAQAAFDQAEARIMAQMIAQTNGFNFGPLASLNFQSPGFDPSQPAGTILVTNVSYYDKNTGLPLTGNAYLQMLNNQLVLPRPPVFVTYTNTAPPDFRYYLDLNRNGIFDPSLPGLPGDPQWIGILQHPDQPHSRSNQYIARYCFFAQPIGNSLDVNYIHNQAKQLTPPAWPGPPFGDSYFRDQGVGSWEINLAGFLNALNPAIWGYGAYHPESPFIVNQNSPFYNPSGFLPNAGSAFNDADSITSSRYKGTFMNLLPPFPPNNSFPNNEIDYFSIGGPQLQGDSGFNIFNNWPGSDNPSNLFTSQDWFIQHLGNFPTNLSKATALNEYTYYLMLSQLGTDSSPETNKLNLNYDNVDPVVSNGIVLAPSVATSLAWAALNSSQPGLEFFTNAANKLLGSHTNFIVNLNGYVTNLSTAFIPIYVASNSAPTIPIYPSNYYTPSVHRMLQLAANIYDATTNKTSLPPFDFDYPSVFRPTFGVTNIFGLQIVYIAGYVEVTTNGDQNIPALALPDNLSALLATNLANVNIFSAPWVIGAKRGFPNFNQVSMQSFSEISRKVQLVKPSLSADRTTWQTNVQYVVGVSNEITVQAWNSYSNTFNRPVNIGCMDTLAMYMTDGAAPLSNLTTTLGTAIVNPTVNWAGYPTGNNVVNTGLVQASFKIPIYTTVGLMPDSVYHTATHSFTPVSSYPGTIPFDAPTGYSLPEFNLNITNRLRFAMVDTKSGRVIDYVQLEGMNNQRQLTAELMSTRNGQDYGGHGGVWSTNRLNGTTNWNDLLMGVQYQVSASLQNPPYYCPDPTFPIPITANDWANMLYHPPNWSSVSTAVQSFGYFYNKQTNLNSQLSNQVPYTPTRQVSAYFTWQANDPLVHYTLGDLTGLGDLAITGQTNYVLTNQILSGIQQVNKRYRPWGLTLIAGSNDAYAINMALKDPMITRSDDWRFPTNKLPSIGWLGKVHRGTPWQTVYMKSTPVDFTSWQNWTGNNQSTPGNPFLSDALTTQPTNDWAIFDLFTTAPNDNATRGQLSVNQTNFAAWAAIFDGVTVETNPAGSAIEPLVIDPNTNASALVNLVAGINQTRTNFIGQTFTQLGQILSAPALTVNSPFLNPNNSTPTDEQYERLPQQVMSLLRVGSPRYVIYAYGQSLKPADNSLQIGGPYFGTCTNYQITGEMETRTVITIEPSKPYPLISTNPAVNFNNLMFRVLNPTQNPMMPGQPPATQPQPRAVIQNFNVLPPE